MKSSDRVRASARYQERHTNEAALRSRREERKWSTFSRTFSRTWSGKGDWNSIGPDPGAGPGSPMQVRVLVEEEEEGWVISVLAGSRREDRRSSSEVDVVEGWLLSLMI